MEQTTQRPWEVLRELIEQDQAEKLEAFLENLDANETVRAIFRLSRRMSSANCC